MSSLRATLRNTRIKIANRRRAKKPLPPYIVIDLNGRFEELPQPAPNLPFASLIARYIPMPAGPLSVHWLRTLFERLLADERVKGALLRINCEASGAVYQGLREEILKFRAAGRRVFAYADNFGPFQYWLACACDAIAMPPSSEFRVLGFVEEYIFLRDALDRAGIGVDVVNVSPFKSAGDQIARNDFSEQSRAQAEWLLDARYDELVRGIAEGRRMDPARVRALIDGAPYGVREAVELGLLDAALYEDELERWLDPSASIAHAKAPGRMQALLNRFAPDLAKKAAALEAPRSNTWITLEDAEGVLKLPIRDMFAKHVGVIGIEGLILQGRSRKSPLPIPLFGGATAGSASVVQALRAAEHDDAVAAVVLYVNSVGGDALASDLMAREIERLRRKKPVVTYMSGIAASGGYYVAAPTQHIVARPLTITGSIGVILTKPHTSGAYRRLSINRRALSRGANAAIFSDLDALDARSREVLERSISRIYGDFKQIVSRGRGMPVDDALEEKCGGRVWTGAQAHARGLVDTLGGFPEALARAVALAGLKPGAQRVGWRWISAPKSSRLPPLAEALSPSAWLDALEAARRTFAQPKAWLISVLSVDHTT